MAFVNPGIIHENVFKDKTNPNQLVALQKSVSFINALIINIYQLLRFGCSPHYQREGQVQFINIDRVLPEVDYLSSGFIFHIPI